jgi:hypothetical protein
LLRNSTCYKMFRPTTIPKVVDSTSASSTQGLR